MSSDDFFNFDPVTTCSTNQSSTPWLFGEGEAGDANNGDAAGPAKDGGASRTNSSGREEFGLPILSGQLFGTDAVGEAETGNEENPLTLSQLMADESSNGFPFDLSYSATSSLFPNDAPSQRVPASNTATGEF